MIRSSSFLVFFENKQDVPFCSVSNIYVGFGLDSDAVFCGFLQCYSVADLCGFLQYYLFLYSELVCLDRI